MTDTIRSLPRPKRFLGLGLVAVVLATSGAAGVVAADRSATPAVQAAAPPPQAQPGRQGGSGFQGWWSDPAIKAEIRLTEEQAKRIKDLFERREAEIRPLADMLNREGERLDRLTKERVVDEDTYAVQVTKVESLYARLRESRTMMIYRMYRELQPEQYKKLQEILDRRRSSGRGSGPR